MLTRHRIAATTGMVSAVVIATAVPAFAGGPWGSLDCAHTPSPVCTLHAGNAGTAPAPRAPHRHSHHGGGSVGAPPPSPGTPGDQIVGPSNQTANCSYQRSDYHPPAGGAVPIALMRASSRSPALMQPATARRPAAPASATSAAVEPGSGRGAWYLYRCSGPGFADAVYRAPVWLPATPAPSAAAALPSPQELAQAARRQLRLPAPSIATNPRGEQLVTVATWLWLAPGWTPQSATATVPGVSVTAVATPISAVWSFGDGSTARCAGAGTPFRSGTNPRAASPDCGHVYRRTSVGRPGGAFPVTVVVQWSVTWSGAGQSGSFPDMSTTASTTRRVAQSQAITTDGG